MGVKTSIRWLGALCVCAVAVPAAAQDPGSEPATPGVSAVRFYQCGLADLDEAVEILNGTWREIANELVAEGALMDYGILTHAWGDEWNLVDYFAAADIESFHSAFGEMILRHQRRDRDGSELERLGELCPLHKDNIYSVVPPQ